MWTSLVHVYIYQIEISIHYKDSPCGDDLCTTEQSCMSALPIRASKFPWMLANIQLPGYHFSVVRACGMQGSGWCSLVAICSARLITPSQVRSGQIGEQAEAPPPRVHFVTVLLRRSSGHRSGRRQALIPHIGLHLTQPWRLWTLIAMIQSLESRQIRIRWAGTSAGNRATCPNGAQDLCRWAPVRGL